MLTYQLLLLDLVGGRIFVFFVPQVRHRRHVAC